MQPTAMLDAQCMAWRIWQHQGGMPLPESRNRKNVAAAIVQEMEPNPYCTGTGADCTEGLLSYTARCTAHSGNIKRHQGASQRQCARLLPRLAAGRPPAFRGRATLCPLQHINRHSASRCARGPPAANAAAVLVRCRLRASPAASCSLFEDHAQRPRQLGQHLGVGDGLARLVFLDDLRLFVDDLESCEKAKVHTEMMGWGLGRVVVQARAQRVV